MFVIITALSMFYLGKSSFRNISLILRTAFDIKVSHTTISNWCTNFAPLFDNMRLKLLPMLDLNSDEWHMDETVVKIAGKKYYLWLIVDSDTRFVIGFHLSPHRDSPQAFSLLSQEVPSDYDGPIPDGFDVIDLAQSKYLLFQGEPFEEEQFGEAIAELENAIEKYDPAVIGYRWDDRNPLYI